MRTVTLHFRALLLALFFPLCVSASDNVPKIIAGVVKADSWTSTNSFAGIYRLVATPGGTLTQLSDGNDVYLAPLGGAVYVDGLMKGIHFQQQWDAYLGANTYSIYHMEYDMATWQRTKSVVMDNTYANLISSCGITHDAVTGQDFGIFYNFNLDMQVLGRKLATIDFSTDKPKKTIIGDVQTPFAALAAADNGLLYGVGQDGYLYIIDKTDATLYPLGELGISDISTYPSSMAWDARSGKLYWSYVTTGMKSVLYAITPTIGAVTCSKVMDVPDNAYLVNMWISPSAAGTPSVATDLSADFVGERTTGTVSFTMPTLDEDDNALTGALTYTIYANGASVGTGTAAPGASVSEEVTVPQSGETELRVVVSNDKGSSLPVRLSLYVGRDTPKGVSDLRLWYNTSSGKAELSWTAPTLGVHGKELTTANLRYDVRRQPGNVLVAEHTAETSFSESLSNSGELKSYYYEVTPWNGELQGASTASNSIVLGDALVPPFSEDFATQAGFDRFTVVDANGDGKTWVRFHKYYSYSGTTVDAASITASTTVADDDYLLTPMLRMERGGKYPLTFTARKAYSPASYDQKVEVLFGSGDDFSAYKIIGTYDVDDVSDMTFEEEIIPEEDGIYRIAFHAISNAKSDQLLLNTINIGAPMAGTAPKAVTDLSITAGEKGALTATVQCTAPTQNIRNEALTSITKIDVLNKSGNVVGTIANPAPGESCTIACSGLSNGYNTLTVVAYVDAAAGEKVSQEAFIGVDRPSALTDVLLRDNGETAYVTWTVPTTGYYGRYINPDALTFNLYTISDDGYADPLQDNISQPYDTGEPTSTGDQKLLYYAVDAHSAAGYGPLTATNSLVVGAPYALPFQETFSKGLHTNQFVWFEGEEFSRNFTLVSDKSADGDGAALCFTPNYSNFGIFSTGKVSIAESSAPMLSFWYYAEAGHQASLLVYVDKLPQSALLSVADIDFTKETESGWKHVEVDLSPLKASPYVIVRFAMASAGSDFSSVVIDNIEVFDKATNGITAPTDQRNNDNHAVYDLSGRKWKKTTALPKGVYIENGKKVVR